jgi:hypothetical protein
MLSSKEAKTYGMKSKKLMMKSKQSKRISRIKLMSLRKKIILSRKWRKIKR